MYTVRPSTICRGGRSGAIPPIVGAHGWVADEEGARTRRIVSMPFTSSGRKVGRRGVVTVVNLVRRQVDAENVEGMKLRAKCAREKRCSAHRGQGLISRSDRHLFAINEKGQLAVRHRSNNLAHTST
eukprot:scaffold267280_cov30-Tisochrysis_lutea.AAC.6